MTDLPCPALVCPILPLLPLGDWKGEEDTLYITQNVLDCMWSVLILRLLPEPLTKCDSFYYLLKWWRIVFTNCAWNSSLSESISKRCLWCAPSVSLWWCIWCGVMWDPQRVWDESQEIPFESWWSVRSTRDIDMCAWEFIDYVSEAGVRTHCCTSSLNIFRWVFDQVVPQEIRKWERHRHCCVGTLSSGALGPLEISREEVKFCSFSVSASWFVWWGWSGF